MNVEYSQFVEDILGRQAALLEDAIVRFGAWIVDESPASAAAISSVDADSTAPSPSDGSEADNPPLEGAGEFGQLAVDTEGVRGWFVRTSQKEGLQNR